PFRARLVKPPQAVAPTRGPEGIGSLFALVEDPPPSLEHGPDIAGHVPWSAGKTSGRGGGRGYGEGFYGLPEGLFALPEEPVSASTLGAFPPLLDVGSGVQKIERFQEKLLHQLFVGLSRRPLQDMACDGIPFVAVRPG